MAISKRIYTRTVTMERYSRAEPPAALFCFACERPSEMMPIALASAKSGISMRCLFRLTEADGVHSTDTDSGQMMICRRSLEEFMYKE